MNKKISQIDFHERRKVLVSMLPGLLLPITTRASDQANNDSSHPISKGGSMAINGTVTVRRVIGSVQLKRPGGMMLATVGTQLLPGDRLETGADGEVTLDMPGGRLAMRPDSQLTIDSDSRSTDGKPRQPMFIVSLWVGALRYVTAANTKPPLGPGTHPRFDTRMATVGVRGTDIDLVFQPQPLRTVDKEYAAGTYLQVSEGLAQMTSTVSRESVAVPAGHQAIALDPAVRPKAAGVPGPASVTLLPQPVAGVFRRGAIDASLR